MIIARQFVVLILSNDYTRHENFLVDLIVVARNVVHVRSETKSRAIEQSQRGGGRGAVDLSVPHRLPTYAAALRPGQLGTMGPSQQPTAARLPPHNTRQSPRQSANTRLCMFPSTEHGPVGTLAPQW
ncbi:hypothetical protein E2C01_082217 [Portunus trituberculatus]|uniref:Uncharacterized protein n=1 Tax=Portunus trituberculatus TaxID=210409 RepID=A0A5B7J082_PORTR|nr:hypothetical protein [Portunus trituberculatus]